MWDMRQKFDIWKLDHAYLLSTQGIFVLTNMRISFSMEKDCNLWLKPIIMSVKIVTNPLNIIKMNCCEWNIFKKIKNYLYYSFGGVQMIFWVYTKDLKSIQNRYHGDFNGISRYICLIEHSWTIGTQY